MKMFQEFKAFAMKGNVMDLAVGVIIGGAFGKIVSSLVNDIMMPVLGLLLGGVDFSGLKLVVPPIRPGASEIIILYGAFLQSVLDFLIIAFAVFLFVKLMTARKKKEVEAPPAPPAPSPEVVLLQEIRDLLKK